MSVYTQENLRTYNRSWRSEKSCQTQNTCETSTCGGEEDEKVVRMSSVLFVCCRLWEKLRQATTEEQVAVMEQTE